MNNEEYKLTEKARNISIDWCVNCACSFAGTSMSKKMFADIFVRVMKNLSDPNTQIDVISDITYILNERVYNKFFKNQVCIDKFWFNKSYWKFFAKMIAKDSKKYYLLFDKKCEISFNKSGLLHHEKDGSVMFRFY